MNQEYQYRINRVIDYIDEHLGEELDLETLAGVASFSKYHFHRIFSALQGETLGGYIQRLRLEKAAALISQEKGQSITEIAYDLNFSSPAVFSRAFRGHFGVSPRDWRGGAWEAYRKDRKLQSNRYQPLSNYGEATRVSGGYSGNRFNQWRVTMKTLENELDYEVEVKELPEKSVVYVRHTGPYAQDGELFERLIGQLMKWAGPRGLMDPEKSELLTIYHDSPEVTEEEKLRISVCLTVPEGTEGEGDVGAMTLPGGRFAVARFRLTEETYGDAWNSLFAGWLPESGFQPAEGPCYELYLNDPQEDPEGKHEVAIHFPVKPL